MPNKRKKRSERDAERRRLGNDLDPKHRRTQDNPYRKKVRDDDDDAPRSLLRIFQKPSAFKNDNTDYTAGQQPSKKPKLDIKREPQERLGDFMRRVDREMPVDINAWMQDGRETHEQKVRRKKKERAERERQKRGESDEDHQDPDQDEDIETRGIVSIRKRKGSPDPWESLKAKHAAPKFGEVVQEPPKLKTPKLKAADIANVPKRASKEGSQESLSRRKMLGHERASMIERYRTLMAQKRNDAKD